MDATHGSAAPESGTEEQPPVPTFEDLAGDPEIAALLDFTPVPRKVAVAGGWSPDKQRELIARLAVHGSSGPACTEMGMHRTGATQLCRSPNAASFRAAWDRAVSLFAERKAAQAAMQCPPGGTVPRSIDQRRKWPGPSQSPEPDDEEGESEERKLELLAGLASKFLRKVAAERAARLNGEIVAADFYLRQVTVLEVLFDLGVSSAGFDPAQFLFGLRRDGVEMRRICGTAFSDHLDAQRRRWWAEEGQPQRPPYPDPRFFELCQSAAGDFAVEVEQHAYGAMTTPARGYTPEEWAAMTIDQQQHARRAQQAEDAAEQRAWEARAVAEHKAQSRNSGSSSPA